MPTFRKKPVVIEAVCWREHGDDRDVVPILKTEHTGTNHLVHKTIVYGCKECEEPAEVHGWIGTLEGGHRVCPGDWIITGVEGERYPCKPAIFQATYEPVLDTTKDDASDMTPREIVECAPGVTSIQEPEERDLEVGLNGMFRARDLHTIAVHMNRIEPG